jgi:hypothetical protein
MLLSVPGGMSMFGASNRNGSAFSLVFELTVTPLRSGEIPAIVFEQPDEIPYFHARIIRGFSGNRKPHNG